MGRWPFFNYITAGFFLGFLLGGCIGYIGSELTMTPPIVGNPAGGSAPSHTLKFIACIVIGIVGAIVGGPIGAVIGGFAAIVVAGYSDEVGSTSSSGQNTILGSESGDIGNPDSSPPGSLT
jgi:hypothetical protein